MKNLSCAAVVLALSLIACGRSSPGLPSPDPAGLTGTVSGTIVNWSAGPGTIEAQARPTPSDPSTFVTLSSGTVAADGTFSLALPGAAAVTPYLRRFQVTPRTGCNGVFTQSVQTAQQFSISTYALKRSDGSTLGYLIQNNPGRGETPKVGDYTIQRIYADQDFTATGTLDCAATASTPASRITLNLNLKQGWNAAVSTVTAVDGEGRASAVTVATVAKLPPSVF